MEGEEDRLAGLIGGWTMDSGPWTRTSGGFPFSLGVTWVAALRPLVVVDRGGNVLGPADGFFLLRGLV